MSGLWLSASSDEVELIWCSGFVEQNEVNLTQKKHKNWTKMNREKDWRGTSDNWDWRKQKTNFMTTELIQFSSLMTPVIRLIRHQKAWHMREYDIKTPNNKKRINKIIKKIEMKQEIPSDNQKLVRTQQPKLELLMGTTILKIKCKWPKIVCFKGVVHATLQKKFQAKLLFAMIQIHFYSSINSSLNLQIHVFNHYEKWPACLGRDENRSIGEMEVLFKLQMELTDKYCTRFSPKKQAPGDNSWHLVSIAVPMFVLGHCRKVEIFIARLTCLGHHTSQMNFILQQGLDGCYFCSGVEMSVSSCGRGRACWTLRRRAIRQDRICLLISRQDKVECSVKLRLTSCMYYVLVHILSTCINALSSPFLEETASNRAELKGAQVCHLSTQSETPCPASAKEESTGLYTSILGRLIFISCLSTSLTPAPGVMDSWDCCSSARLSDIERGGRWEIEGSVCRCFRASTSSKPSTQPDEALRTSSQDLLAHQTAQTIVRLLLLSFQLASLRVWPLLSGIDSAPHTHPAKYLSTTPGSYSCIPNFLFSSHPENRNLIPSQNNNFHTQSIELTSLVGHTKIRITTF
ncbi:hypothetical protein VP01_334g1 [Puccinia sorghi]|uniref:Uncharacterized protein n=1 Tax=Puccinia sorghi TaxID=27349 RepID=A0A0L6UYX5_9BASI|nr:hypothetical protein VP01_334g1 [Puccinia sorghi]